MKAWWPWLEDAVNYRDFTCKRTNWWVPLIWSLCLPRYRSVCLSRQCVNIQGFVHLISALHGYSFQLRSYIVGLKEYCQSTLSLTYCWFLQCWSLRNSRMVAGKTWTRCTFFHRLECLPDNIDITIQIYSFILFLFNLCESESAYSLLLLWRTNVCDCLKKLFIILDFWWAHKKEKCVI